MRMSSKKTMTNFLKPGARVMFIAPWKVPGAPVRPNAITVNSYWPK
jgi:hypothetical protein